MIQKSYKKLFIYVLIGITSAYSPTTRTDFFDDYINSEPHFIDTLDFMDETEADLFNEYLHDAMPLKQLTPDIIVSLLYGFGITDILQQDFFLKTNPLVKRSMLDSPLFEFSPNQKKNTWFTGGSLYFNLMPHSNYTRKGTRLDSYLALSSPILLDAIEETLDRVNAIAPGGDFSSANIRKLFTLAADMRIEQRNLGVMLHCLRRWDRVQFRLFAPLEYHERNYFLTQDQQDEAADILGDSDPNFQQEHVICDRFGLGDTRVEVALHVSHKKQHDVFAGLFTTIPTAFTMAKNFYGSSFPGYDTYPDINFNLLYEALNAAFGDEGLSRKQQEEVTDLIQDFFLCSLDRMSANLLDDGLGRGRHFSIGGFIWTEAALSRFFNKTWAHNTIWSNRFSLEYRLPKYERRSFINKNNPHDFAIRNFEDDDQAEDNLRFLEQELINKFYLLSLSTSIQPGLIFRWTSKFEHTSKYWHTYAGLNLWVQQNEHFGTITMPEGLECTFDIDKAKAPTAYQLKLAGGFAYKFDVSTPTLWSIGLNADATLAKSGIGRDYTLALRLDANF